MGSNFGTIIGTQAGPYVGNHSTMIGAESGFNLVGGSHNLFIGYRSGFMEGASLDCTGCINNIIVGSEAGYNIASSSSYLTAVGSHSGQYNRGKFNTFIGRASGLKHTLGNHNTFVGTGAGGQSALSSEQSNEKNTFAGFQSGYNITTGDSNSFLGSNSGRSTTTGLRNTFLGYRAGFRNTTGSGNVFIGARAGDTSAYQTVSNTFVVGNPENRDWMVGEMTATGNLYVNGMAVLTQSSRVLKKDIQEFSDFEKPLKDLIDTPLFTYSYKREMDRPHKIRMGVISEELPDYLQLKAKGRLSHPDWPSIYGFLWAGIKALYKMIKNLNKESVERFEIFMDRLNIFKSTQIHLRKKVDQLRIELSEAKIEFSEVERKIDLINKIRENNENEK